MAPKYDWSSAGQIMHTFQDYLGAGKENDRIFNAEEAQKQRDWEKEMSNTAHQRQVADMKEAGLNPALSVTGGAGASTPTGSSAHTTSSGGGFSSLMNSSANLVRAFNNDKDKSNNLNAGSAVKLIETLSKLFA